MMTEEKQVEKKEQLSTSAIITYIILAYFGCTVVGIFLLIIWKVEVKDTLLGVLGGLILTVTNLVTGAVGYWLGSSSSSKTSSAVVAQLAGAGAPPPADPLKTS